MWVCLPTQKCSCWRLMLTQARSASAANLHVRVAFRRGREGQVRQQRRAASEHGGGRGGCAQMRPCADAVPAASAQYVGNGPPMAAMGHWNGLTRCCMWTARRLINPQRKL